MLKSVTSSVIVLLLGAAFHIAVGQNSQNVSLKFQYDDPSIGGYNDVWGYHDNGTEVAIIGTTDSILFLDITNTSQVIKLPSIAPGGSSSWRDIKCHGKFCYAVTDNNSANEGLLVVDMDSLLNGTLTYQAFTGEFQDAHNIFIDEGTDKLYVVGSDNSEADKGYIVYDLGPDPYNPTCLDSVDLSSYVSCSNSYIHDLFVRNDTAYCNMIYSCGYYVFDVSTPGSPVLFGSLPHTAFQNGYNHSNWITSDGNYAVVAEETHGNPVHIVDISDPSDMDRIATWKDPLDSGLTNNIAHNPIIKGNFCYISYYHDGLCVLDISNPLNPVRVAYYDTHPPVGYNGYQGAWGVYPLLPSGLVLISDRTNGLHVLEVAQSVLPVEWITFDANEVGNGQFNVSGQFQSTEHLEKAEVYWSADGRDFTSLHTLNLRTDGYNLYSFNQMFPRPTRNAFFIKVKTTEIDGFTEYSEVRKLNAVESGSIIVYPNPVKDHLWVENAQGYDLELRDIEGRLILSDRMRSNREKVVFPESLNQGMYFLHLQSIDSDEYVSHRILHQ